MILPETIRRLYPFESRYLDRNGWRYHYLDEGTGPPVLMVHGNPTWSFYYRELVRALRGSHRCIVPDHIGCGLSDKPDDTQYRYTLEVRVDDLDALLTHLGIEDDLTVVVHDWGGMIGLAAALRRLSAVRRVVILNTAAFLLPPGKRLPMRLKLLRRRNPLATLAVQGLNAFAGCATWMATKKGLPPEVRAGLVAPYDSWANRRATLRFVQDIPLGPLDPAYPMSKWVDENLHQLAAVPMLICWGDHDFVFDRNFLAEWRRRFPRAEVHTFADAGHYVLEDAGDRIIPLVQDFLRRQSGSTAPAVVPQAVVNVAAHLHDAAQKHPEQRAIVWALRRGPDGRTDYAQISFGELDRETDRCAHGLVRAGVTRGMRTILMVRPSIEFFVLTFALYKIGAVPVLIDPGMGRRRMVECLRQVDAQAFIGIPLAHLLRLSHRQAFRTCHIHVTIGTRWCWGGWSLSELRDDPWRPFECVPTRSEDPAAIIFTTGSTGPPKGVLFEHGMFDAQVRILRDHFGIRPGEIDLPTFPLFALFDPALGMTAVLPEMDPTRPAWVDPTKIIGAIRDQQVTHMFGSPALLNRVGLYGEEKGVKLPSLRRVISAGAPVPPETLARFVKMLEPEARIHTPYGATEALPVASIDHAEVLVETASATSRGAGTCVGKPMREATVRILRIRDVPIETWSDDLVLPPGEIGEVVVKGPMVTRRYCTNERANRLHKIREGGDVWHRMGDVGYFDDRGRIWFCGRKSHRVITPGGTLFTEPCEAIFNGHARVFRSALVGVGRPPDQRPVICIELREGDDRSNLDGLTHELLEMARAHEHTRAIESVLYHQGFPVDIRHNSKIFREQLAAWASERLTVSLRSAMQRGR